MLIKSFRTFKDNKTVFNIKGVKDKNDLDIVYKFIYNFVGIKRIDISSFESKEFYVIVYDVSINNDNTDIIDKIDDTYILDFNKENFNKLKRKING